MKSQEVKAEKEWLAWVNTYDSGPVEQSKIII